MLPYITRTLAGKEIKLLIDTGTSKNYIAPRPGLKGIAAVENPFSVRSIHGHTKIEHKCLISLFIVRSQFFILKVLKDFDGIVGLDLLKQVNARLDLTKNILEKKSNSPKPRTLTSSKLTTKTSHRQ